MKIFNTLLAVTLIILLYTFFWIYSDLTRPLTEEECCCGDTDVNLHVAMCRDPAIANWEEYIDSEGKEYHQVPGEPRDDSVGTHQVNETSNIALICSGGLVFFVSKKLWDSKNGR